MTAALMLVAGCAPAAPVPPTQTVVPVATNAVAPPTTTTSTATLPTTPTPMPTTGPTPRPTPSAASTPVPRLTLDAAVHAALGRHPRAGTVGVVVTRLSDGETVAVNATMRFRSASLYKLFVLEAVLTAQQNGQLPDDEVLTVTPALATYDPYLDWDIGTRATIGCAVRTMIEMSGNAAADLLLQRVGLAAIDARITALGLHQSALTDETAFTSPADMALLLGLVARGELVSPSASQRTLELLSAQQHNDRIPAPLPLGIRVAHKTGELPGVRHDAAIVFAPSGAYVLVTMVQGAPTEAEARAVIVDLSQSVYGSLEPTGLQPYLGLPQRLARQVFGIPDTQGRLALLGDPRTETATLPPEVALAEDAQHQPRLRTELVADLLALQH
ncbi:MAG TPA: serine hydrolase, partial [Chloroflexota bacterium]|nr:serine hydrolase [Chloroflexota bacterium]